MKDERKNTKCMKECKTVTCIHCIGNMCMTDECQYYERHFKQEH